MNIAKRWELGSIITLVVVVLGGWALYVQISERNKALAVALEGNRNLQVRRLIDQGAMVNTVSPIVRNTALHRAARSGDSAWVADLLSRGAGVNAQSRGGWTPLMHAADVGDLDIVQLLLTNGANPNLTDGQGQTALTCAVQQRRVRVVHLLMVFGANPQIPDSAGLTPEALAMRCRFPDVVQLLRDARQRHNRNPTWH